MVDAGYKFQFYVEHTDKITLMHANKIKIMS